MLTRRGICRPSPHDQREIDRLRKFAAELADILKRCPVPDTFLAARRSSRSRRGRAFDHDCRKKDFGQEWIRIGGNTVHRDYRSLERQCRIQASLTGDRKTRREFEEMEREYRKLAEWLERQSPAEQTPPSEE